MLCVVVQLELREFRLMACAFAVLCVLSYDLLSVWSVRRLKSRQQKRHFREPRESAFLSCVFGGTGGKRTLHSGPISTLQFLALNPNRQYRQCHTLVELDDGRALTIRFSLLVFKCDDTGALVSACGAS